MGYFISGDGSITIKKTDEPQAYKAMCDLNQRDDLKRGGSWGGEHDSRNPRPEGLNYHPGKWFSWLHPDYPSTCDSFLAVLEHVGFEIRAVNETGDSTTYGLYYSNKSGQEELFLDACAPYITGEVRWEGEDGERWRTIYADGTSVTQTGRTVYS